MAGFKDFVLRGNVVDLAVGVIIGGAFGGIVNSMVKDVITPLMTPFMGANKEFDKWDMGPVHAGLFVNAVISFFIQALVVYFLIVKPFQMLMSRLYPPPPAGAPPAAPPDIALLTEIRDLLKTRG